MYNMSKKNRNLQNGGFHQKDDREMFMGNHGFI